MLRRFLSQLIVVRKRDINRALYISSSVRFCFMKEIDLGDFEKVVIERRVFLCSPS